MKPKEITLRNYFAARAMQGMLSNSAYAEKFDSGYKIQNAYYSDSEMSKKCYLIADLMIKESEDLFRTK